MSVGLFLSQLRSAVRAAQNDEADGPARPSARAASRQTEVLRQVARGELTVEAALAALEART